MAADEDSNVHSRIDAGIWIHFGLRMDSWVDLFEEKRRWSPGSHTQSWLKLFGMLAG